MVNVIFSVLAAFLVLMGAFIAFFAARSMRRIHDPEERARIEDRNSFDVTIYLSGGGNAQFRCVRCWVDGAGSVVAEYPWKPGDGRMRSGITIASGRWSSFEIGN